MRSKSGVTPCAQRRPAEPRPDSQEPQDSAGDDRSDADEPDQGQAVRARGIDQIESGDAGRGGNDNSVPHEAVVACSPVDSICGEAKRIERLAKAADDPGSGGSRGVRILCCLKLGDFLVAF